VSAPPLADAAPSRGAVLVRLPAHEGGDWATSLPTVPTGWTLTVSLGHPALLPIPATLRSRGYEVVGVATARAPVGRSVDVLVPAALRAQHPDWWERIGSHATRIFDLRMGPVLAVLGNELALHHQRRTVPGGR
jgi:hypothetical protein